MAGSSVFQNLKLVRKVVLDVNFLYINHLTSEVVAEYPLEIHNISLGEKLSLLITRV